MDELVVEVSEELEPLIPRFLEKRRKDAETVKAALDAGDLETLRTVGHSLKGTAGGYGFHGLTDLGGQLEAQAKAGDLQGAAGTVEQIGSYMARVRVEYV